MSEEYIVHMTPFYSRAAGVYKTWCIMLCVCALLAPHPPHPTTQHYVEDESLLALLTVARWSHHGLCRARRLRRRADLR